ncbi:MAG TPA: PIG-L family deacetylase [Thermoanaerobaculia bacterium]|nr:PIG-L family deacetylase [Thermoanaerobaculia bacterium]
MAIVGLLACREPATDLPVLQRPRARDRVLIVAPHVDDEAIAAAGYAGDALAAGAEVFVVYLTVGDGGFVSAEFEGRTLWPRSKDYLREGEIRIGEAHAVMALLGVPETNLFILGYPDGDLRPILEHPDQVITSRTTRDTAVPYASALSPGAPYRLANLERDLDRVLAAVSPTLVIAPVVFDAHPDHHAGAIVVRRRLARLHEPPPLLSYLVHARVFPSPFRFAPRDRLMPPRRRSNLLWLIYPLSPAMQQRKQTLLRAYKSQRKDPYLRLLLDAFMRRNELFVKESAAGQEGRSARLCGSLSW